MCPACSRSPDGPLALSFERDRYPNEAAGFSRLRRNDRLCHHACFLAFGMVGRFGGSSAGFVVAALNAASAASREVVVLRVLSADIYLLSLGLHFLIRKLDQTKQATCPLCANSVLTRRSKSTASLPSPMLINCTQTELDATGRRSRLGTWPTRNGLMPAGQVGELWSDFYVCQTTADVDCDQRGDVGDRETVASDKLVPA